MLCSQLPSHYSGGCHLRPHALVVEAANCSSPVGYRGSYYDGHVFSCHDYLVKAQEDHDYSEAASGAMREDGVMTMVILKYLDEAVAVIRRKAEEAALEADRALILEVVHRLEA